MKKLIRGIAGAIALAAFSLPITAANAQQQQPPVKIGFGMALSGGLAAGGKAALLVYQIWAEEVNARGGLLGRKVDLVYYDDQSNPSTVPGIYTKLLDVDKADLVISGYATVPTAAAMPIIIQRNKLFLSLFALGANNQFDYPRYFQIQPNGPGSEAGLLGRLLRNGGEAQSEAEDRRDGRRRRRVLGERDGRRARKHQEDGLPDRLRQNLSAEHDRFHPDRAGDEGDKPGPLLHRVLSAGLGRHDPRRQRSRRARRR